MAEAGAFQAGRCFSLTLAARLAMLGLLRPSSRGRPHFISRGTRGSAVAADSIPMTKSGAEAIKRELKRLKSVERPRNVQDIATARDHGDLRENAEYHAAKERQSHIEGRIQMLEDRLARAEIIDVTRLSGGRVVFGATVRLEDSDSGAKAQYTIVGETEADLKKSRISITSPIARGLIGREVGDSVRIRTPGGEREYEILEVVFVDYEVEETPEP
jgi:transcription elongation factor GreA